MELNDMVLVSIDDHAIEAADTFKYMPEALKDQAPVLTQHPDNPDQEAWVFQGAAVGTVGLSAVVGLEKEEWGFDPTSQAEMRPGTYDWDARVADMNACGVLTQMEFPTFAGFAGSHLARLPDTKLVVAAIQAYNDYYVGDICNQYPGRFIPMGVLPTWDVDASVKEIHRLATLGCKTITLPDAPYAVGLPEYASGRWDPILKAMVDTNMVASLHIGAAFGLIKRPESARHDDMIVLTPCLSQIAVNDLIIGGTIKKFPELRVAMSEGGVGWASFLLDRLDRHITNQTWTGLDCLPAGKTVHDVWRDNFLACFITEPSGLDSRHRIGVETIAWELDYPHSDSTWPFAPEVLWPELQGANMTDKEIDQVTHENAMRFYDFDPFVEVSKENATVGALRALAKDVDIEPKTKAFYKQAYDLAHANA
jgi:predicted TIM-barrel fold metal-dependent hydrolase